MRFSWDIVKKIIHNKYLWIFILIQLIIFLGRFGGGTFIYDQF